MGGGQLGEASSGIEGLELGGLVGGEKAKDDNFVGLGRVRRDRMSTEGGTAIMLESSSAWVNTADGEPAFLRMKATISEVVRPPEWVSLRARHEA